jgi:hypothetical protein
MQDSPPASPHDGDSDVEIDEQDHVIFQEFGHRVDFLGILNESALKGTEPPSRKTAKTSPSAAAVKYAVQP